MRVIALMPFFDELPTWLGATTASVSRFCDHLVAVDGAYALYPDGRGSSGTEQSAAIREAAEAVGIGCTLHIPSSKWQGNEVEKRTFLFSLGSLVAEDGDWFLIIDADELLVEHPSWVKDALSETNAVVAEVSLRRLTDYSNSALPQPLAQHLQPWSSSPVRRLYRALPNIRVEGNHFTYVADYNGTKTYLWNRSKEPALDLTTVVIEHRNHLRPQARASAARTYYSIRDRAGAERGTVLMETTSGDLAPVEAFPQ